MVCENNPTFLLLDPELQGRANARAARDPTVLACFAAESQQSSVGNPQADVEYALTPQMNFGASLRYDKAANWQETGILVRLSGWF